MRISLLLGIFLVMISACRQPLEIDPEVDFIMNEIDDLESYFTTFVARVPNGQATMVRNATLEHGFVWSQMPHNGYNNPQSEIANLGRFTSGAKFQHFVSDLEPNKTYYVRGFLKTETQVLYTNEQEFRTPGGSWKRLKDFPGAATVNGQAIVLEGRAYVMDGDKQLWMYDPVQNEWEQKQSFWQNLQSPPVLFTHKGKAYLNDAGWVMGERFRTWEYEPQTDRWTPFEFNTPSRLALSSGSPEFTMHGKPVRRNAYHPGNYISLDVERKEWESFCCYPTQPAQYSVPFVWRDSVLYAVGNEEGDFDEERSVFKFDTRGGARTVSYLEFRPQGYSGGEIRSEMSGFVIDDVLYLGMGYERHNSSQTDFYKFDPSQSEFWWEKQASLAIVNDSGWVERYHRTGAISFAINGKGYVGLGEERYRNRRERIPYFDLWEFTPSK